MNPISNDYLCLSSFLDSSNRLRLLDDQLLCALVPITLACYKHWADITKRPEVSRIHIEMPRGTPVTKPKPEPQPADVQLDPRKYLRITIRWLPIKTNMHLKFGAGRRLLSHDTLCLLCDTPS
jgi:hypothetical protein